MTVNLFLGRDSAVLAGGARADGSAMRQPEAAGADAVALVDRAWELLPPRGRLSWLPRLSVRLSSAWARPFMVSPVAGLRNWPEVMAWARTECRRQIGAEWRETAEVWVDRWSEGSGGLGVAADRRLLDAVKAKAKATGWRVASVQPWWATPRVLAGAAKGRELLLATCEDGVAWLVGDVRRVYAAGAWVPSPPEQEVTRMQRRLAVAHPDATPRTCQWHEDWLRRA